MSVEKTLSTEQARRVYDLIGPLQDLSAVVEDRANRRLIQPAGLSQSRRVLELGCGTGRFAARLLRRVLPLDCDYTGIDVSPRMRQLARRRLRPFGARATVLGAATPAGWPSGPFDVVLSTFVIDLLDAATIRAWMAALQARLEPGGRLALTSMALPNRSGSFTTRAWMRAFRRNPLLVGGCRPVDLGECVPSAHFETIHSDSIGVLGIRLGVLVAVRR